MLPLTEIIRLMEARQQTINGSPEGSAILALAVHVKNLENKVARLEAEASCNPKT